MPWTADDAERHTKKPTALNVSACGQKSPIRYWLIPETKDALFREANAAVVRDYAH
jgi:hypothetical protein